MKHRTLSVLFLALVVAVATVGLTEPAQAASPLRPLTTPSAPWVGDLVTVKGKVAPSRRPVVLQRRVGARWVKVASSRTRSGGAYAFRVRATATRTAYRVQAPRTKQRKRTYAKRTSSNRWVTGRRPVVRLTFAPAPVGVNGATPAVVRLSPARSGVPVRIERRTSTGWTRVASGTTVAGGVAELAVAAGSSTFRAVATTPRSTVRTVSAARTAGAWKLRWHDEFHDGLQPAWLPRSVGDRGGRRVCSTTAERNTTTGLTTGNRTVARLRLTVDPAPAQDARSGLVVSNWQRTCPHGTYFNAMVGTGIGENKQEFVHGVFAASVRFQAPRGMHGAFWLQSAGTPEIDVAEYFGDGRGDGGISHFLHPTSSGVGKVGGINPIAARLLTRNGRTPADGFHVYSVEWTSAGYVFRVDGRETLRTTKLRSNDPHFLVMSLLASDAETPGLDRRRMNEAYMDVDWVRVWQR